ncbi:ABC transporter permease [Streptomyces sp. NPDC004610]|uniref:ABC transporter permease n=1 Tax=unclassified Streptomyces TaxID=2593676 RepID=UPI0033B4349E
MSAGTARAARAAMGSDVRLAWALLRGSDRREWWRVTLTGIGAALATGFALAAVSLAALRGTYRFEIAHGLLDQPGERAGVVLALVLLLIPVLGFLGQCARIGAVHRDRRLAGLRLAGGTPWQVRRIAAYETGLACLAGSAVATVFSVLLLLTRWGRPTAAVWAGIAVVAVGVPVAGALVGVLALRRVVASPLGWVRRVRAPGGRAPWFVVGGAVVGVPALLIVFIQWDQGRAAFPLAPVTVWVGVVLTGLGAVGLSGLVARLTGRRLAARTSRPAVLIAAERLCADPWAAARTHAAALLVTVVGAGFVGVRAALLDILRSDPHMESLAFYTTGLDLTAAAIGVALLITLGALAVGAAESLATRRRGLAAQSAAGVPRAVLGRALLLETALPLAPALLLAGAGGLAVGTGYATLTGPGWSVPWASLLVPVVVYAGCLLAAATALPLLGRSVRPGELRYG